jgi:hypothetical protein
MIAFIHAVNPLELCAICARFIESFLPIRAIVMTTCPIAHAQEGADLVA